MFILLLEHIDQLVAKAEFHIFMNGFHVIYILLSFELYWNDQHLFIEIIVLLAIVLFNDYNIVNIMFI